MQDTRREESNGKFKDEKGDGGIKTHVSIGDSLTMKES